MNIDFNIIGKRIATRRVSLNMTQDALAEKANMSRVQIAKIEKSTPKKCGIGTLVSIARALDVTPNYLLLGAFNTLEQEQEYVEQIRDNILRCSPKQRKHLLKYIEWLSEQDDY